MDRVLSEEESERTKYCQLVEGLHGAEITPLTKAMVEFPLYPVNISRLLNYGKYSGIKAAIFSSSFSR